jgi:serine O-acetyltransferase
MPSGWRLGRKSSMERLRADLRRALEHQDGGPVRRALLALCAPGTHAVVVYRFGHWALAQPLVLRLIVDPLYQLAYLLVRVCWGIELPRAARIGGGLYIGHFGGIVVSRRAIVGRNCALTQGVTLGVSGYGQARGSPVIGDDVYIGPGARVLGPVRIGNNVMIGSNAVVYRDIPDDAVVVLDPGFRIVSYRGNRRLGPRQADRRRTASTG